MTFYPSLALGDNRYPNQSERQKIERVLTAAGYTSWGEIELDDDDDDRGIWDVENARHKNGHRYDLELDARTLRIIDRDRD
ncbi:PepSY domain-containing protein [Brucella intermedia]|nr:PepSY domain-containing protein [Brucella intermedia]